MRHSQRVQPPSRHQQRGQALVFTLVTALVMLLAMLTLFSIGQLTTEKMKLQNTADATAYSAALAQARDYNFSAYLNRGMIANDVAVAQMVSLSAWSKNYNDTFNRMTKDVDKNFALFQKGPLYPLLWTIPEKTAATAATNFEIARKGFDTIALGLLTLNESFMTAQKIYHFGTALTVAQTIGADGKFNDMMKDTVGFDLSSITDYLNKFGGGSVVQANDPEARLSALGMAGYMANVSEWMKFTRVRNPLGPWGEEGEWKCRPGWESRWSKEGYPYCRTNWYLYKYNPQEFEIVRKLPGFKWGSHTDYTYVTPSYNVTKIHPKSEDDDGPQKDRMAGVVTSSLDPFTTDRSRNWWLPLLIDPIVIFGPSAHAPPAWFFKMLMHDGQTKLADDRNNQNYRKDDSWNQRWDATDSTRMFALNTFPVPIPFYGFINVPAVPLWTGNPGLLGTDAKGKTSAGTDLEGKRENVAPNKTALRAYRDVADIEQATATEHHSSRSPALLVEVEKPTKSIATSRLGGATASGHCAWRSTARRNSALVKTPFEQGSLHLQDGSAANCMRAMAKAEAYFSRPTDLFARADGATEYGSLYSPYWQARLVPVNTVNQMASLYFHGLMGPGDVSDFASAEIDRWKNLVEQYVP